MTAEILTLPVIYRPQGPPTGRERTQDRLGEAYCWVLARTVQKLPIVLVRRSVMARREVNAFELGRECAKYLDRCRVSGQNRPRLL